MMSIQQSVRPASCVAAVVVGAGLWLAPFSVADAAPYPPIPTTVSAPTVAPGAPGVSPPGGIALTPTGAAAPVVAAGGVRGFPGGVVAPGAFPVQAPTGAGPAAGSDDLDGAALVMGAGAAALLALMVTATRYRRVAPRRRPR